MHKMARLSTSTIITVVIVLIGQLMVEVNAFRIFDPDVGLRTGSDQLNKREVNAGGAGLHGHHDGVEEGLRVRGKRGLSGAERDINNGVNVRERRGVTGVGEGLVNIFNPHSGLSTGRGRFSKRGVHAGGAGLHHDGVKKGLRIRDKRGLSKISKREVHTGGAGLH